MPDAFEIKQAQDAHEEDKLDMADRLSEDLAPLERIEEHLRSIRSMLTFFTVLAVLGIILQGCSILGLL